MLNQKFYSAITILGLTVGITFAMLIGVFIWGEMKVNRNLKDVDRLYLMETKYNSNEGTNPPFLCLPCWVKRPLNNILVFLKNTIGFVIGK
jgi:hypothetical protein